MKVIADLEPPRGPFFGAMFWAGFDGGFDSSVLIRTAGLRARTAAAGGFEARAGGRHRRRQRSDAERLETEAKIGALANALLCEP